MKPDVSNRSTTAEWTQSFGVMHYRPTELPVRFERVQLGCKHKIARLYPQFVEQKLTVLQYQIIATPRIKRWRRKYGTDFIGTDKIVNAR